MLESRGRGGLQIVSALQRHYLNMSASKARREKRRRRCANSRHQRDPAGKALGEAERLGARATLYRRALDY